MSRWSRTALTLVAAGAPVLTVALIAVGWSVPVDHMTRDVAAIASIHPLSGFLSSLGILLWWSSATVWLFTARHQMAHRAGAGAAQSRERSDVPAFFACSSALSAYFALDDLFQFHEQLAPVELGIPERAVYALIALSVLAYLAHFRPLSRGRGRWLALAVALLASSVAVDLFDRWLWRLGQWTYLLEDGLKWAGIVAWTRYALQTCGRALRPTSNASSQSA